MCIAAQLLPGDSWRGAGRLEVLEVEADRLEVEQGRPEVVEVEVGRDIPGEGLGC